MPAASGLYYSSHDDRNDKSVPPVVLIHGAGSSHLVWPAQIRRLRGCCSLAIDLSGHGHSKGVPFQSIEDHASSVKEFLDAANIFHAVLVGHSMGGAVALTAALQNPERVAGVGLISSGAYLGGEPAFLDSLLKTGSKNSALDLFQKQAFAPSTSPLLISRVMKVMQDTRAGVLTNDWQACANYDLRKQISQLKPPLWVAIGAEDRLTPVSFGHYLKNQLPQTIFQVISGAGHMVLLEKPEELTRGLISFMEQIGQTALRIVQSAADNQ